MQSLAPITPLDIFHEENNLANGTIFGPDVLEAGQAHARFFTALHLFRQAGVFLIFMFAFRRVHRRTSVVETRVVQNKMPIEAFSALHTGACRVPRGFNTLVSFL